MMMMMMMTPHRRKVEEEVLDTTHHREEEEALDMSIAREEAWVHWWYSVGQRVAEEALDWLAEEEVQTLWGAGF
jgi:hypothetical protein